MFIFFLFALLMIIYIGMQMRKPRNFPPGPIWLPFVGNVIQLKKLSKSLGGQHHAFTVLAEKYKTNVLGLKLGAEYVAVVLSYRLVRQVLINEAYEGRPDNFFLKLRCMGKKSGITATEGEIWSSQRYFANRHLRNLGFGKKPMEEIIQDEVQEIVSILETDGGNISVDTFLAPGVINVLWTLVTGERIPREDSQLQELLNLFNMRSRVFDMTGGILTQYPWLRHVMPEFSGFNLIKRVNFNLKQFFMDIIRKHQETWEEGKNDDLIYQYISEMKMNTDESKDFNEDHLIMICLDLFIGGAQTTSGTLDFAFLIMILYPDVQKKVQEQIDEKFGNNSIIQYADRQKVPYVQAVICEIMRYRNVLPITGPRRAMKDTTLDGYSLPKDTTILISLHSVHNDPEYWTNPDVFMPERFMDKESSFLPDHRLIPFGLGRRRCLGEVLAKNCIFVFFIEILRKYNVTLAPGSRPLTGVPLPGITLSPECYKAKFTRRSL